MSRPGDIGTIGDRRSITIIGQGACLPDEVRTNGWWADDVVESWPGIAMRPGTLDEPMGAGPRLVARASCEHSSDPFHGSRERRVLPGHVPPSTMEVSACREAIEDAGISPGDIDFVLGYGSVPDHLAASNACAVHRQLGLREDALVLTTDASFNAFAVQMSLAHALISSGRHGVGLLFQSNAMTRLVPPEAPYSPWFGDAATAAVVARAREGRGLLAVAHGTDGSLHQAMVADASGQPWHQHGAITWHPGPEHAPSSLLLGVADRARAVIHAALGRVSIDPGCVDYYAAHQPTVWFRRVTQLFSGLHAARYRDTFSRTASLGAANVPFVLYTAQRSGMLHTGDIVVAHTGGLGACWSALVLRWG